MCPFHACIYSKGLFLKHGCSYSSDGLLHLCVERIFFPFYLCSRDSCKLHEGMPIEVIKGAESR